MRHSSPVHHCITFFSSIIAWNTRSGGAAIWISETRASWFGVTAAVVMATGSFPGIAGLGLHGSFRARQFEVLVHLLAVHQERPVFAVVLSVGEGEDETVHMPGIGAGKVGSIDEGECDGLAIGRHAGLHAWLVADAGRTEGHLERLALAVLPFPGALEGEQAVKCALGVGLGKGGGGQNQKSQSGGCAKRLHRSVSPCDGMLDRFVRIRLRQNPSLYSTRFDFLFAAGLALRCLAAGMAPANSLA